MQAVQVGVVIDAVIIAIAVGVVGTGSVVGIRAAVRWVWRSALDDFGKALDHRIEGAIKPLADDISYVKAQLEFNGGSTVKDQVGRVVKWIDKQEQDQP